MQLLLLIGCREQNHSNFLATGSDCVHGRLGLGVRRDQPRASVARGQPLRSCCGFVDGMAPYPSRHGPCLQGDPHRRHEPPKETCKNIINLHLLVSFDHSP